MHITHFFQHNYIFDKQKFGSTRGSEVLACLLLEVIACLLLACLLLEVLACLLLAYYLNFCEIVPFKFIIVKDSNVFRCAADIFLLYLRNNDLTKITDELNIIELTNKKLTSPVGYSSRIRRIRFGIESLSNECPGYDTKPSDGELWGVGHSFITIIHRFTLSWSDGTVLLLLLLLLLLVVVVAGLSMGPKKLFNHLLYLKPFDSVQTINSNSKYNVLDKNSQSKMFSKNFS